MPRSSPPSLSLVPEEQPSEEGTRAASSLHPQQEGVERCLVVLGGEQGESLAGVGADEPVRIRRGHVDELQDVQRRRSGGGSDQIDYSRVVVGGDGGEDLESYSSNLVLE